MKFMHVQKKLEGRSRERDLIPFVFRRQGSAPAHLSVCLFAHTDGSGCSGSPSCLLLTCILQTGSIWLMCVKSGLRFEYLHMSGTLAGVSHPSVGKV